MTPAALKAEFLQNPKAFIGKYIIHIDAVLSQKKQFMQFPDGSPYLGNLTGQSDVVSGTAPTGWAKFSNFRPARTHDLINCGSPAVDLKLVPQTETDKIPFYVIPYQGNKGYGVKLPAGDEEAFVLTQKINGCTLVVNGPHGSPCAAHANAFTVPHGRTRLEVMMDHVRAVEARFREILGDEYDEHSFVFEKLRHPGPRTSVEYTSRYIDSATVHKNSGFSNYRFSKKVGHAKKIVKFSDVTLRNIQQQISNDNAIIGHRDGGIWKFYFNSATSLDFDIIDQRKLGGLVLKSATENFTCSAITAHGQMWPVEDITDVVLIPDAYANAPRYFKGAYT